MIKSEHKDQGTHKEIYIYYNGKLLMKRWREGIYSGDKAYSALFGKWGRRIDRNIINKK